MGKLIQFKTAAQQLLETAAEITGVSVEDFEHEAALRAARAVLARNRIGASLRLVSRAKEA